MNTSRTVDHDVFQNILDWYLARKWNMTFADYMTVKIEDGLNDVHAQTIKPPLIVVY